MRLSNMCTVLIHTQGCKTGFIIFFKAMRSVKIIIDGNTTRMRRLFHVSEDMFHVPQLNTSTSMRDPVTASSNRYMYGT